MDNALAISRLANTLLGNLEAVTENTVNGESMHAQKMELVLNAFAQLEQIWSNENANQSQRAGTSPAAPVTNP